MYKLEFISTGEKTIERHRSLKMVMKIMLGKKKFKNAGKNCWGKIATASHIIISKFYEHLCCWKKNI